MPDTGNNEPAPTRVGDALLRYSGMGSRLRRTVRFRFFMRLVNLRTAGRRG